MAGKMGRERRSMSTKIGRQKPRNVEVKDSETEVCVISRDDWIVVFVDDSGPFRRC